MTVAVVGGAGYVGAHVVRALLARGERVVVVDDLSTSDGSRVTGAPVHRLDVAGHGAADALEEVFAAEDVDAVVHLAARKSVAESVLRPLTYAHQNLTGTLHVLDAVVRCGVPDVLLSSTAAVYGSPDVTRVDERTPARPINPYGETKLAGEWLCAAVARAHDVRTTALRYFNVAGTAGPRLADTGGANLVPIVLRAVRSGREVTVFGDDYPTPDGTCVRDYVHVEDVADAHAAALEAMRRAAPGRVRTYNVGTGTPHSVREVIDVVGEVTGRDVRVRVSPRRAGDPASLTAAVGLIADELGWTARHDLVAMVSSAWGAIASS